MEQYPVVQTVLQVVALATRDRAITQTLKLMER
jgi:hypothetical protein